MKNKYVTDVLPYYRQKINVIKKALFEIEPNLKLNKAALYKEIFEILPKFVDNYYKDADERGVNITGLLVAMYDMKGEATHYYIEDDALVQFLKETEVKHPDSLKINRIEDSNFFIVHTHKECYVFVSLLSNEGTPYVLVFDRNGHMVFNPEREGFQKAIKKIDKKAADLVRLALNYGFYVDAFPDVIKPGLPSDMCKTDRQFLKDKNNKFVTVSEKIVDVSRSSKTPHFRKGFFRTYYADRYVNMKGKTQFIEATFINKEKAKTVETI